TQISIERKLLCHVTNATPQFLRLLRQLQTKDADGAFVRREQTGQQTNAGGLAGTIGAKEAVDHAAWNIEIEMIHRREPAKAARETAGFYRERAHGSSSCAGSPAGRLAASSGRSISIKYTRRERSLCVSA